MANRGRQARIDKRRFAVIALVGTLLVGACSGGGSSSTSSTTSTTTASTPSTSEGSSGSSGANLITGIRLSKGHAVGAAAQPVPVVKGTPLDDAAIQAVVDRLPEWTTDESLEQPFNWPVETRARPRPGATVDVPFPARLQPPPDEPPPGPLHVLRVQPNGDVAIAPFVTITFDQPMVPIATVGQLADADVPATITPDVPGHWQWIGTKTLRFDADSDLVDRLPMATDYTVTVPAGITSAVGGALEQAVAFEFATPPATVQTFVPTGDLPDLTPVFVAIFDQRIDPQAVLATIVVHAGSEERAVRSATSDEVDANDVSRNTVANAPEGRWLAFRPVDPLPADTPITVDMGPGTPSEEGPAKSAEPQSYSAHTYPPLRVLSVDCAYGPGCPPPTDIIVNFNNALDPQKFDPASVVIDPPIAAVTITALGSSINIHGDTQARTTYHVTVPAGLTDVHGQQLGADEVHDVNIGAAAPVLQQFPQPLMTADPLAATPSISVFTVNHRDLRVRLFQVTPDNWLDYMQYVMNNVYGGREGQPLDPPWPVLMDETVPVTGDPDRQTETAIDLSTVLQGSHGHVVVLVEPTEQYAINSNDYWMNRPAITWAQATSIGVDAFTDASLLHAWTTKLVDGTAIPGVAIHLAGTQDNAITNDDGLATVELPIASSTALVATLGDDSAILPGGMYFGGWQRTPVNDEARWYMFDDRGTYRPGEKVSIKGWVRKLTSSSDSQIALVGSDAHVTFSVQDAQGNVIANGDTAVNPIGGFDFAFDVPEDANLGTAMVALTLAGAGDMNSAFWVHPFEIQQFRTPEFEVKARNESAGPYRRGAPITVASDADYYAGGPLGAAPVKWQVTTASATYAPPGWDEFTFGIWTPWWYADTGDLRGIIEDAPCCFPPGEGDPDTEEFDGVTDADGTNYLQIDVGHLDPDLDGLPVTVSAQATVTDVNRQAWSSTTNVLVHPADLYVGLRSDRPYVGKGDPLEVDVIVTDIDGNAVAGRSVTVTASRVESVFQGGQWVESPIETQTCDITSAEQPVPCTFTTSIGGTYEIKSTIVDDSGRASRTELTRWVSGAEVPPTRNVEQQELTIVPDQAEYQPGSTAQVLVQAPFATGTGLLTVSRGQIVSTNRFDVVDGSAVLQIPIGDRDVPNLDLMIEVVGATERADDDGAPIADAPLRPAFATGSITLPVSVASRTLQVAVTPSADTVEPGADTSVDVTVSDPSGSPVAGSELAVVVADEAVLALSGYSLHDPLDTFYSRLMSYASAQYGRQTIVLANPLDLFGRNSAGAGDEAASAATAAASETTAVEFDNGAKSPAPQLADAATAGGGSPIGVRTNFAPLAVFAPSVVTDASGHATVDVPLPDNLTRYRVMVVAVAGPEQFGSAEANITARLPLMVRPSAPRFLNFGDAFELPVVLQNQTAADMTVDVVLQTDNLQLTGDAGVEVTVPANDRIEVRFPAAAAEVGTARFRVAAVSGDAADAATVDLPVYTPTTAEAFATYGVIDDGTTLQPVSAPTGVVPQFGGLDVTTSSTSLQALTDAVLYVSQYPYESSDALASQILAIASLRDVLAAFDAPDLPSPGVLDAATNTDIGLLADLQNDDGGFPYWQRGRPSDPFNSIQATHALVVARAGGFGVPQATVDRALSYLHDIEQHIPIEYGQEARDSLSAYALHVRMLAGDRDPSKAKTLFEDRGEQLPLDAIAWLWPVVTDSGTSAAIERIIENRAVDTAGAVTFTTNVSDDDYLTLRSDRRTDGLILDSLITVKPDSDLIPKIVAGLLAGQTQGRWDNIQENAFILLALKHYFDAFESQTPDFVARIWLGDRFAGEQAFQGRSTDRLRVSIPTADLVAGGDTGLTISKEGTGRLYYRIGLRTAPADLHLDPLDRGFVVGRTYEAVDDPADVTRSEDGTWHIKAGAKVRVRLTMVAESQRTHVALIDPLPAGLEIINPELATSENLPPENTPPDPQSQPTFEGDVAFGQWWYPTWFDHQNMRDDRAESFATYLAAGTYDYSYVARATTPGSFVVPPARAEEMYAPETFGRGSTDAVVIDG
jgi:alpha-2-macroglobulin